MFGRKKRKPTQSAAKTETSGGELHINMSPDAKLRRLEKRLERVNLSLESGKWPVGSSRELEFSQIKKRLEMQIKIAKGDF